MITIGIRASPKEVTFAVYDSDRDEIINIERIVLPLALGVPERLKYARSNLIDVLRDYKVEKAGIRETEPSSQHLNIERIRLEGVIQEAFASSPLKAYYVGQISSISSRIGIERSQFKLLVEGDQNPGVEHWSEMSPTSREAVLCAKGAVNA